MTYMDFKNALRTEKQEAMKHIHPSDSFAESAEKILGKAEDCFGPASTEFLELLKYVRILSLAIRFECLYRV